MVVADRTRVLVAPPRVVLGSTYHQVSHTWAIGPKKPLNLGSHQNSHGEMLRLVLRGTSAKAPRI